MVKFLDELQGMVKYLDELLGVQINWSKFDKVLVLGDYLAKTSFDLLVVMVKGISRAIALVPVLASPFPPLH